MKLESAVTAVVTFDDTDHAEVCDNNVARCFNLAFRIQKKSCGVLRQPGSQVSINQDVGHCQSPEFGASDVALFWCILSHWVDNSTGWPEFVLLIKVGVFCLKKVANEANFLSPLWTNLTTIWYTFYLTLDQKLTKKFAKSVNRQLRKGASDTTFQGKTRQPKLQGQTLDDIGCTESK